jgi:hypothetical protein
MNISVLVFALMAIVTIPIMTATVAAELNLKLPVLTQTGDSSLGPQSVNWLGAAAFIAAILICTV